jgi:hypothetical protein
MTLFGNGRKSSQVIKQVAVEQSTKKITLRDFVQNDEKLYDALQTFLLGDPKRQLPLLGSTDSLLSKANEQRANGENIQARLNYETAAKIELYRQNKEGLEKFLRLADETTGNGERGKVLIETMLAKVDEALRISKEYYYSAKTREPVV